MSNYLMIFFNYHYPSSLVTGLYEENQNQNDKIVKLRNSINSKEIPQNENRKRK